MVATIHSSTPTTSGLSGLNARYRDARGGTLRAAAVGQTVRLAGWVFRRRDHGGVVFIDLRDSSGIVQVVFKPDTLGAAAIETITHTGLESVIQVDGKVILRGPGLTNPNLPTGEIEIEVTAFEVLSKADPLPYALTDDTVPEELRLSYRFMDLRRQEVAATINLRSDVIASIRRRMWELGFREYQTPILTASSPEGARDFLVPSRLHPGKFYALPQAPQQFKQLLMIGGFDRYFQIAPCFRDEDARADRSPADFYQLDMEMSFIEQDDIFAVAETVVGGVFEEFRNWNGNGRKDVVSAGGEMQMTPPKWVRIPYLDAMERFACDKPDLRCPLEIKDVSSVWVASEFKIFKDLIAAGGRVRAIGVPGAAGQPRSWFDEIGRWAQAELGSPAAPGYIALKDGEFKGPLTKFLSPAQVQELLTLTGLSEGGVVFFVGGHTGSKTAPDMNKILNPLRVRLGKDCGLNESGIYKFCWITDFPMFERADDGSVDFSHNPFSMPQGGLHALETQDPLTIRAFQYDLVCNGYELCSGAIRNHLPAVMLKAFEIAGYGAETVQEKFRGLWQAFHYGAPPHGGMAPGIDRIVMLLAESNMVREVIAFPLTQRGEDLLMAAPTTVSEKQLKELHIKLR